MVKAVQGDRARGLEALPAMVRAALRRRRRQHGRSGEALWLDLYGARSCGLARAGGFPPPGRDAFIDNLKASPTRAGVDEIPYPGELSQRLNRERKAAGRFLLPETHYHELGKPPKNSISSKP